MKQYLTLYGTCSLHGEGFGVGSIGYLALVDSDPKHIHDHLTKHSDDVPLWGFESVLVFSE